MNDIPVHVDFLINSPEVKAKTSSVKKDIIGAGVTGETVAKKLAASVNEAANAQQRMSKGTVELSKALGTARFDLQSVNNSIRENVTLFKRGEIGQKAYTKNISDLIQRESLLKTTIKSLNADLAVNNQALLRNSGIIGRQRGSWNGLNNSINQVSRELPAFAVSAQIGILALSNNIPILADEINNLKIQNQALVSQGQKSIPIWKSIAKGIFGWQTALSVGITLLTLYGREIGDFFSKIFKSEKAFEKLKANLEAVNTAVKSSDFKSAISDINELRVNVQLANDGFLDADAVVRQYNKAIGDAAGEVDTLAEAEQALIDKGDAYIEMMLYKAAAAASLDESSKILVENTKKQLDVERRLAENSKKQANQKKGVFDPRLLQAAGATQFGGDAKGTLKTLALVEAQKLKESREELIKAGEALQDSSDEVYTKLIQRAAEIANGAGLNVLEGASGAKTADTLAKQRQSLLDKISDIDRDYARKQLDSDEAEVQALKDKFTKVRELIADFNTKVKGNENSIDIDQVNELETKIISNLRLKQEADRLEKERKEFEKQLSSLQDYEAQRTKLVSDYQLLREKLLNQGYKREAAELSKKHIKELGDLDDVNARQLESYNELFAGIEKLSDDQAQLVIDHAKNMVDELEKSGRISGELAKKILIEIGSAEKSLADRLPDRLSETSNKLKDIAGSIEVMDGGLGRAIGALSSMVGLSADLKNNLDSLSDSSESEDRFGEFSETLGIFGVLLNFLVLIKNVFDDVQNETSKHLVQNGKVLREIEEGELRINKLYRERALLAAEIANSSLGNISSQGAVLESQLIEIQKEFETVFAKMTKEFDSRMELLLLGRGASFIESLEGEHTVTGSLAGKTYEEIEKLYEEGRLFEQGEELFEQLRKLKEEGADIEDLLNDLDEQAKNIFTGGTTSNAISDSIIEGFRQGKRTVQEFGDDVEDILKNAVLSGFKYRFLEEPLNELIDQLYEDAKSGDELDAGEIAEFTDSYNEITEDALRLLKELQDSTGLDFSLGEGDNGSGLSGSIQRGITESTANELAGLYRSQFDVSKRTFNMIEANFELDKRHFDSTLAIMASNERIAQNTADTNIKLASALVELQSINTNTKPNSTGYDRGI